MKKKVLSMLLAAGLVAGLTACGNSSTGTGETTDNSAAEETTSAAIMVYRLWVERL